MLATTRQGHFVGRRSMTLSSFRDSRWIMGDLNTKSFFNAVICIFLEITILSVTTYTLEIKLQKRGKT